MTRATSLIADDLLNRLRPYADPARAAGEKRYLKSDLDFLGVRLPLIRRTVGALRREHPGLTHAGLVALVTELWSRPVHELRMAAVELLAGYRRLLTVADLPLVEGLIRTAGSWAYVDPLSEKVAAGIVATDPAGLAELDHWSRDPAFWVRRAAMLALLPGLKRDGAELPRFSRYADAMLGEREFFIRKAIGWVLREVAKRDPAWTAAWVSVRIDRVSGVTLREAVRYVDPADRDRLLAAYRERPGPGRTVRRSAPGADAGTAGARGGT